MKCPLVLQQNTSSLWSINEPFYIHLLQGSRVNADEGMKVGVVLCGFSLTLLLNEVWHSLVYQYLYFSCTNGGRLTCKWQGGSHGADHTFPIIHQGGWLNFKTGSGEGLSDFYVSLWGLDSKKKGRLHGVSPSLAFSALLFLKPMHARCYYCRQARSDVEICTKSSPSVNSRCSPANVKGRAAKSRWLIS